jgi:hypothetical protein
MDTYSMLLDSVLLNSMLLDGVLLDMYLRTVGIGRAANACQRYYQASTSHNRQDREFHNRPPCFFIELN